MNLVCEFKEKLIGTTILPKVQACYLLMFTRDNCVGRCPRLAATRASLEPLIRPTLMDPKIERHTKPFMTLPNIGWNLFANVTATASEDNISEGLNKRKYEKLVRI